MLPLDVRLLMFTLLTLDGKALNPGNLKSDLGRTSGLVITLTRLFTGYPTIYGAYTELFAGTSPDVTLEKTGCWSESRSQLTFIRWAPTDLPS